MMTTVYGAYPVSMTPDPAHVEHVMAAVPYRKWEKERGKDMEKDKNKKRRPDQKGRTDEHDENVPGQIGCFFEAKV